MKNIIDDFILETITKAPYRLVEYSKHRILVSIVYLFTYLIWAQVAILPFMPYFIYRAFENLFKD